MTEYTPQTWANGLLGGTPINAARLQHMEDGIAAASRTIQYINGLDGSGLLDNSAIINNEIAAANSSGSILAFPPGDYLYSAQLLFSKSDMTVMFSPGARLIKDAEFTDLYSIYVTGARVKFYNLDQDGQRSIATDQTYGMLLGSSATGTQLHDSRIRSNKFHGIEVSANADLTLYNCDISDNVHSAGAGYGVLGFGNVSAYGNNTFSDNGYIGFYLGDSTRDCHVDGYASGNTFGFNLHGYKGTSNYLKAEDNSNVDIAVTHASEWEFGTVISTDGGLSGVNDGIGFEFYGSSRCKVNHLSVTRARGFGLCFARRQENPVFTVATDPGTTPITLSAAVTSLPTAGAAVIENEYITWSGKSGSDITGVTRGQRATTPATHAAGRDFLYIPSTTFTSDPGLSGTTWDVADTSTFCSGGFIWAGDEIVSYTGKTATSFTGVKRAQLNTTNTTHAVGTVVAPFLESHHNDIGTYVYDGYGTPDGDPGIQISGGSSWNRVGDASIHGSLVAVSIGEEPWPKSNDYNEIESLYVEDCVAGAVIITGGNNNRIRRATFIDVTNVDSSIADAVIYFDDQRANLTSFGFGTVNNNVIDMYENKTVGVAPPTGLFSQKHTATGNYARTRLTASVTWDPGSVADLAATTTTLSVPGARIGDIAHVAFTPYTGAGVILVAIVYDADSVVVTLNNRTGGTIDLASGTLYVEVLKHGV